MKYMTFVIMALLVNFSLFAIEFDKKSRNTKQVTISINSIPTARNAFYPIFDRFEQETGIEVIPRFINDFNFHSNMDRWLNKGEGQIPDILFAHSHERLKTFVEKDAVHSLEPLWQRYNWQSEYRDELVSGVSFNGERYAVPFAVYTWGLFYTQSLVEKFGKVPRGWPEFLLYCAKLKQAGMTPFVITHENPYIAAAWFEYLVLRMYGLELFTQIINGKITYFDSQIQLVFKEWKKVIDMGIFSTDFDGHTWEQYLPHFLRNEIAFIFSGSPIMSRVYSDDVKSHITFMAFPKIANIKRFETAPTDVFFIPERSENKKYAEIFLAYLLKPQVQSHLAKYLYTSPANKNSQVDNFGKLAMSGHEVLISAEGWSPFFDRGTKPAFEKEAVKVFIDFFATTNIDTMTKKLELLRLQHYKPTEVFSAPVTKE